MAFWEATKSFFSGDFKEAGNLLLIDQDEVDRGKDLDRRLAELAGRDLASNKITPEEYQRRLNAIQANAFEPNGIFSQEGTDLMGGFIEGAGDGLSSMQQGVKKGLANTVNFGAGLIPWQVWLLAGVFVGYKLGLFDKILSRK